MLGKVKWFNNIKGFGFITIEGKEDIFIHYSQIISKGYRTLSNDEIIKIGAIIRTEKGYQAQAVEKITIQ